MRYDQQGPATAPALVAFINAMGTAGMPPIEPIAHGLASGELVRFKAENDKRRNGWAVFFDGDRPMGVFGHYRLALKSVWRADGSASQLSPRELTALKMRREAANADRHQTLMKAASKAGETFNKAEGASDDHPYLVKKGLDAFGIRQKGTQLLIPLFDEHYRLWSLQFIRGDGTKRFLPKGRTAGLFWPHGLHTSSGDATDGPVIIAEGYATAAACHEATGYAVAAAMSAANMPTVAKTMRHLFPARDLIVAADWDGTGDSNIGLRRALAAARPVGAALALPLPNLASFKTKVDFADLSRREAAFCLFDTNYSRLTQ